MLWCQLYWCACCDDDAILKECYLFAVQQITASLSMELCNWSGADQGGGGKGRTPPPPIFGLSVPKLSPTLHARTPMTPPAPPPYFQILDPPQVIIIIMVRHACWRRWSSLFSHSGPTHNYRVPICVFVKPGSKAFNYFSLVYFYSFFRFDFSSFYRVFHPLPCHDMTTERCLPVTDSIHQCFSLPLFPGPLHWSLLQSVIFFACTSRINHNHIFGSIDGTVFELFQVWFCPLPWARLSLAGLLLRGSWNWGVLCCPHYAASDFKAGVLGLYKHTDLHRSPGVISVL